jgi:hypothetical protein
MSHYTPVVLIGGAVLAYVGLPALVHINVNPIVGGICSLATPNAWERMKCEIEAQQPARPSPAPALAPVAAPSGCPCSNKRWTGGEQTDPANWIWKWRDDSEHPMSVRPPDMTDADVHAWLGRQDLSNPSNVTFVNNVKRKWSVQ